MKKNFHRYPLFLLCQEPLLKVLIYQLQNIIDKLRHVCDAAKGISEQLINHNISTPQKRCSMHLPYIDLHLVIFSGNVTRMKGIQLTRLEYTIQLSHL